VGKTVVMTADILSTPIQQGQSHAGGIVIQLGKKNRPLKKHYIVPVAPTLVRHAKQSPAETGRALF
jgi:hypothetical protein